MAGEDVAVERALSGDRAAFEALVAAHWPLAERIARGILRDAQLAEDVAQDVFADIYVQRARLSGCRDIQAYVAAMARYKSIDLLRRRKQPLPLAEDIVGDERTPEDALVQRMFESSLYAAIERLPEPKRRMIKAFALEGRSYREIAAELGVSVAQVKIALFRIRMALRKVRQDWS